MKNKVLVKFIVPYMDLSYNIYLPVNIKVYDVIQLVIKIIMNLNKISDLTTYIDVNKTLIINKDTGRVYNNNEIIYDTDIRNGTELVFLVLKQ